MGALLTFSGLVILLVRFKGISFCGGLLMFLFGMFMFAHRCYLLLVSNAEKFKLGHYRRLGRYAKFFILRGGKAGVLWATKPFPLALNRGTIPNPISNPRGLSCKEAILRK